MNLVLVKSFRKSSRTTDDCKMPRFATGLGKFIQTLWGFTFSTATKRVEVRLNVYERTYHSGRHTVGKFFLSFPEA